MELPFAIKGFLDALFLWGEAFCLAVPPTFLVVRLFRQLSVGMPTLQQTLKFARTVVAIQARPAIRGPLPPMALLFSFVVGTENRPLVIGPPSFGRSMGQATLEVGP